MHQTQHRSDSFVLRIWWEQENGDFVWRCWVQHAASGGACYICRLADLVAFVEMHTGSLSQAGVKEHREEERK